VVRLAVRYLHSLGCFLLPLLLPPSIAPSDRRDDHEDSVRIGRLGPEVAPVVLEARYLRLLVSLNRGLDGDRCQGTERDYEPIRAGGESGRLLGSVPSLSAFESNDCPHPPADILCHRAALRVRYDDAGCAGESATAARRPFSRPSPSSARPSSREEGTAAFVLSRGAA